MKPLDTLETWPEPKEMTLPKGAPAITGENAWSLRSLALDHVRRLAGKIWTDHNIHDPGIATLDVLCFALSDLGYRSNFDIADLLAEETPKSGVGPQFFTAREILTSAPVTALDFRKLMIDTPGVKNAWIKALKRQETDIFVDRNLGKLVYDKPVPAGANKTKGRAVDLRGLSAPYLELERDLEAEGDLNSNSLRADINLETGSGATSQSLSLTLDVGFSGFFDPARINKANPANFSLKPLNQDHEDQFIVYQADWSLEHPDWGFAAAEKNRVKGVRPAFSWYKKDLMVPVLVECKIAGEKKLFGVTLHLSNEGKTNLNATNVKTAIVSALKKNTFAWIQALLQRYQDIVSRRLEIAQKVYVRLQANRPLCEDFPFIYGKKIEEIALCTDVEVEPSADCDRVYSDIRFQIEQFMAPDLQFRSLEYLLDSKVDPAEIFEGPKLDHGFLDPLSLKQNELRTEINTSDLINIIMDIEGVVAVRDIMLSSYVDNRLREVGERWSLKLKEGHRYVPRLSTAKSKIHLYKGYVPCAIDHSEADDFYEEAIARQERRKLAVDTYDIPVPEGTYRDISGHTSIQNHFPLNFGIGPEGLAGSEPDSRKAKAAQLKGYLMFYDQILANYLAQLANARHLLSVSGVPAHVDFVQPIYDAPDVAPLIKDFISGIRGTVDLSDKDAVEVAWATYVADDPNTGYRDNLQAISDSQQNANRRQNLIQDHLLARFSEQFTDYAMLLYDLEGRTRADAELIEDKAAFLRNYPAVSSRRGTGFDYFSPSAPRGGPNISGLAFRVARLMGMPAQGQKPLAPPPGTPVVFKKEADGNWGFTLNVPAVGGFSALTITTATTAAKASTKKAATEAFHEFLSLVSEEIYAQVSAADSGGPGQKKIEIRARDGAYLAESTETFADEGAAEDAIAGLMEFVDTTYFLEGLHVVEHILLRPFQKDSVPLLPIVYDKECKTPTEILDPYSFRISVVLPALAQRFRNQDMRRLVERTLHMEAPAHVSLKICWVDYGQLRAFEKALKAWIRAKGVKIPDAARLAQQQKNLINVLGTLRSIYPTATLHDCENPDESINPVVLGHTAIGSFIEFDPETDSPVPDGD